MTSPEKGKAAANRNKSQAGNRPPPGAVVKGQPRRVPRNTVAPIPWYFWAGLGALIIGGVVVLGTILAANPTANPAPQTASLPTLEPNAAANATYAVNDARGMLTNGYGEGNPNAPVTLVEFGDFECPACKIYYDQVYPQIKQAYVDSGKVYYYYKPFPITNIHPKAMKAASLAVCADDMVAGKFYPLHDLLYQNQDAWVKGNEVAVWTGFLTQLGLEPQAILDCANSGKREDVMNANIDEAVALQVPGTPQFYVNSTVLPGATLDSMRQAIEAELAKVKLG